MRTYFVWSKLRDESTGGKALGGLEKETKGMLAVVSDRLYEGENKVHSSGKESMTYCTIISCCLDASVIQLLRQL